MEEEVPTSGMIKKIRISALNTRLQYTLHVPERSQNSESLIQVFNIKRAIEISLRIPVRAQVLGWKGMILENDEENLQSLGLEDNDILILAADEELMSSSIFSNSMIKRNHKLSAFSNAMSCGALFSDDGSDDDESMGGPRRTSFLRRLNSTSAGLNMESESSLPERKTTRTTSLRTRQTLQICPQTLNNLVDMGFNRNAGIRALVIHKNKLELALDWLTEHHDDPSVNGAINATDFSGVDLSQVQNDPQEKSDDEEFA